jgi:SNF2 family DNA or RNA helicase
VTSLPAVPAKQQDRVFRVAQSLASVIDVQSDIEGAPSIGEEVDASAQIVAQVTPYHDGLRAELFVQPFGEKGPFCRPGAGAQAMLANVEGRPFKTTRNLKAEQKNLQQLLSECHPLEARTVSDGQTEWLFAESDDALEFVVELQTLADQNRVSVLWPRGKTHDVAGSPSASGLQVSVRRDRDWFAASGKLKVDSDLTVDLMKLLDLVSASPSRFVQLDDGRFLALTQDLRQRIADVAAFGTPMKGKLRFAPVRATVVDELFEDVGFKTDKHWKSHLSRIKEAGSIPVEVPSTMQADLRDYQLEGYAWLKRLAHWNTGACLADDMGLGKTIQALSLLVDRAFDGPQLVVAPASVGFNWEAETRRFAPTLTPKLFRDCDRDQFFDDIQPGDLAITSYGLLQSEIERFEAVQWQTALLDEAQAIKNMATKRSQAVMQLQANFRIILTGTPMENHLGELWNLFRFIVPGLLGSQEDFRKRFAVPIERDNCRPTRNRLKKLIQPFLLRRTKSEVLTELPARSESVLEVELSPAEAALYEALRQKALERITEAAADSKSQGEQHLQVLAELTRLRLACCHPELVGGEGIESTKLDLFRQKISEIVEGHHKVLVFSQFVKHLDILGKELDEMGVSYQRLDGSTSVKKRKQAVEAFQSGEGDVFLISLRAGGTGLNLTAADYVIHMDPWWNPAVEDQATDRAHRIGQQRPVNVYRLITKGTIEEKIVDLHNTKRDLADSLLEGSDSSGKLTTEELIGLLKDNQLAEAAG